jgi:hypothetical protein
MMSERTDEIAADPPAGGEGAPHKVVNGEIVPLDAAELAEIAAAQTADRRERRRLAAKAWRPARARAYAAAFADPDAGALGLSPSIDGIGVAIDALFAAVRALADGKGLPAGFVELERRIAAVKAVHPKE